MRDSLYEEEFGLLQIHSKLVLFFLINFTKRWRSASTWTEMTRQHKKKKKKPFQFLLFCWGHDVLAPPSGQEYVAAEINESGLNLKTDGRREEVEIRRRWRKKGREKIKIKHDREEIHSVALSLLNPRFLNLPFVSSFISPPSIMFFPSFIPSLHQRLFCRFLTLSVVDENCGWMDRVRERERRRERGGMEKWTEEQKREYRKKETGRTRCFCLLLLFHFPYFGDAPGAVGL